MIESLFNGIVEALEAICRATGLTYAEINILIYCGFIPASWFILVYLRRRRWVWLLALHLLAPMVFYWQKKPLAGPSKKFYDANISALELLVKMTGWSYVEISVLLGVVIPILIYSALLFAPKRWLLGIYVFLIVGNLAWYVWALQGI